MGSMNPRPPRSLMDRGRVGPRSGERPIEAMEAVRRTLSLATLQRTRALLRGRRARLLAVAIALAYVLVSMVIGQLLTFPGFSGPSLVTVQWTGDPWYDFPELFVFSSGVALDLLLLPTVTMVLVSAGVGLASAAALVTAFPRLRGRAPTDPREVAATSAASAGAAVTGLATMACCCTTCASAAGVAVVAAASGADLFFVLSQAWYLALYELVVVALALLVQERSLRRPADACGVRPTVDRGFVLGTLVRIALLVAGITWSLAMFVEWAETAPLAAGPGLWYHWIVEHQGLAFVAVAAGLFPQEAAAWVRRTWRRSEGRAVRVLLLLGGATWGLGVPPPLVGAGLGGFVNEALGFLGLPSSLGGIAPDVGLGPALAFHWAFQHLLLAAFAIGLALVPETALGPLLRTVETSAESGSAASAPPSTG